MKVDKSTTRPEPAVPGADPGLPMSLFELAPDALFLVNPDGSIIRMNEIAAELFSCGSDELVGQPLERFVPESYREQCREQLEDFRRDPRPLPVWSGSGFIGEYTDRSELCVEVGMSPVNTAEGQRVICAFRDVTEREAAQRQLKRSYDEFRALAETTRALPWRADAKAWRYTYVGPQAVQLLGYPVEQWFEEDFWVNHIHPDDREFAVQYCQDSSLSSSGYDFEYRMMTKTGKAIWIQDFVSVSRKDGKPSELRGYMIDISERKKTEERLRESESRYRGLYHNAPVMLLSVDETSGKIIECNETLVSKTGFTREQLLGSQFCDLYLQESEPAVSEGIDRFSSVGQVRNVEFRVKRSDGGSIDVSFGAVAVRDASGRIVRSRCVFEDISERKKAEAKLRESEQRYRDLFDNAPDIFYSLDISTRRFIQCNKAMEQKTGYTNDEIVGRHFFEIYHPDCHAHIEEAFDTFLKTGEVTNVELQLRRADGRTIDVSANVSAVRDAGGRILYSRTVLRDITERKQTDQKLLRALAEIEELKNRLQAENIYLREEIKSSHDFEEIVGESPSLKKAFRRVDQVASSNTTVLILGETGTGKELIARAVHNRSSRKERPLIRVNCAALPDTLIESELFGHEKGAFTGAINKRTGRFELADGGTIFLDEIGDLPPDLQAKLLRVLQEGEFERLGSAKTLKTDVRVIAATNRNLESLLEQGRFRPDLYFRLKVLPIELPPLRDRRDDIPLLVWYFVTKIQAAGEKKIETVPQRIMDQLVSYSWPGNVRELRNVVERSLILSPGKVLQLDDTLVEVHNTRGRAMVEQELQSLEEIERSHILSVLKECDWKIKGKGNAAENLGLNPSTLRSRMNKLGLSRPGS